MLCQTHHLVQPIGIYFNVNDAWLAVAGVDGVAGVRRVAPNSQFYLFWQQETTMNKKLGQNNNYNYIWDKV